MSSESLHVLSIGFKEGIHIAITKTSMCRVPCILLDSTCAELNALLKAQKTGVDLTKYHLYTTSRPCLKCTKVILQAGIRVVVHGGDLEDGGGDLEDGVNEVYKAKACFKYDF